MIKPYVTTYKFYYNNKLKRSMRFTELLEESLSKDKTISGISFESLCELKEKCNLFLRLIEKKNKNNEIFLEFDDVLFLRITSKNCKPWRLEIKSTETEITMKELFWFESEKVIQYLKERGIASCPIIK